MRLGERSHESQKMPLPSGQSRASPAEMANSSGSGNKILRCTKSSYRAFVISMTDMYRPSLFTLLRLLPMPLLQSCEPLQYSSKNDAPPTKKKAKQNPSNRHCQSHSREQNILSLRIDFFVSINCCNLNLSLVVVAVIEEHHQQHQLATTTTRTTTLLLLLLCSGLMMFLNEWIEQWTE